MQARTRTILIAATIVGIVALVPLVIIANRTPAIVTQDAAANRLDLWVIMMARVVGPFGIPVGLLAAWFLYANEQYRQAIGWLALPIIWGIICLAADLAATYFGPWLL
jgi:hypothetical protein